MSTAAIVTIKDAGMLTPTGRKDIAKWLRKQAKELEKFGEVYSGTVRARYLYEENKK